MSLDPFTLRTLSPLLHNLAKRSDPRLIVTLRPQDPIPAWITHLIYLDPNLQVAHQGRTDDVIRNLRDESKAFRTGLGPQVTLELGRKLSTQGIEDNHLNRGVSAEPDAQTPGVVTAKGKDSADAREPVLEMESVQVRYGDKQVLGGWLQGVDGQPRQGLWWTVRRGQRWSVFGPNGKCCRLVIQHILILQDRVKQLSSP